MGIITCACPVAGGGGGVCSLYCRGSGWYLLEVVWCGGKYLPTGLIKTGVSCVLVGCTELVSICNDNVTVHMRRRGKRCVATGDR